MAHVSPHIGDVPSHGSRVVTYGYVLSHMKLRVVTYEYVLSHMGFSVTVVAS
jgi:hypothetical protein